MDENRFNRPLRKPIARMAPPAAALGAIIVLTISSSARGGQKAAPEAPWLPAPAPLLTRWAKDVNPGQPLPEYPRPQLVRSEWANLNGLWEYAVTAKDAHSPERWEGKVLVPFPIESALSGVKRALLPTLWFASAEPLPRERSDPLLDAARGLAATHELAARCGATSPEPRLVVLRVLALRSEPAWTLLTAVWQAWRELAWGLAACPPRVWRT